MNNQKKVISKNNKTATVGKEKAIAKIVYTPFNDLRMNQLQNMTVKYKVLKVWVSENRKTGEVWSLEAHIMDEQGTQMRIKVNKDNIHLFQGKLLDGGVYSIQRFTLQVPTCGYRIVSFRYIMWVNKFSKVQLLEENPSNFPTKIFTFLPLEIVPSRNGDNRFYTDVIGRLHSVSNVVVKQVQEIYEIRDVQMREICIANNAGRNRGPKFTQEEDITLWKAYLFLRVITGVVISHDRSFWENVFSMSISLTGNPGNRDARRLRARFHSIRLAVQPFLALVIEIDREKFSAVTEDEVIQTTLDNWEASHGNRFHYEACFRILKDGPSQAHRYCTRVPLWEFTMEEDVVLVRCWLYRMVRPMNNDNFWERVLGHFVASLNETIRNSKSLKLRITFITYEVKHYTEVLWMVHHSNSGLSNKEMETIARTKFTEESGREFRHFECYELYRENVTGFDVV